MKEPWSQRRRQPVKPDLEASTVRVEMTLFDLKKLRKKPGERWQKQEG